MTTYKSALSTAQQSPLSRFSYSILSPSLWNDDFIPLLSPNGNSPRSTPSSTSYLNFYFTEKQPEENFLIFLPVLLMLSIPCKFLFSICSWVFHVEYIPRMSSHPFFLIRIPTMPMKAHLLDSSLLVILPWPPGHHTLLVFLPPIGIWYFFQSLILDQYLQMFH